MKRLRMVAFAAVAGLAFVPGCCCFDGQMLNRMGFGPRPDPCCDCATCGCSTCGSAQLVGEGPMLGDPNGGYQLQPPAGVLDPGSRVLPGPMQAQPMPAPVSTTKIR